MYRLFCFVFPPFPMKRFTLLFAMVLALGACAPSQNSAGRLSVATSFYPIEFLAERIGGPDATVWSLLPPGVEPHDAEPSPAAVARLTKADLLLYNGFGLDPWAQDLASNLPEGHAMQVTENIVDLLELPGGGTDPHVWLDGGLIQWMATRVRDALVAVDPEHEAAYGERTDALLADLRALDKRYRDGLKQCAQRDVVTSHDAFQYVAWRNKLTIHPVAGISPEDEPSPKQVADLVELIRSLGISTVFTETTASPKVANTLASETGVGTATLHSLEGLTPEERAAGEDYISIMDKNLAALREALGCQ